MPWTRISSEKTLYQKKTEKRCGKAISNNSTKETDSEHYPARKSCHKDVTASVLVPIVFLIEQNPAFIESKKVYKV